MLVRTSFFRPTSRPPTWQWGSHTFAILLSLIFGAWVAYRWGAQPQWLWQLPANFRELLDLAEFGGTITLTFLWGLILWRRYHPRHPLNPSDLLRLSPAEFEQFTAEQFGRLGYSVKLRGKSGDLGVDLELTRKKERAIVQCKRYQKAIGPEIVRELYGTLLHEKADRAYLVTTATISNSARQWAEGKPLILIDGQALLEDAKWNTP